MEATQEKRNYPRKACAAPISLYRMESQDHSFYAQMNDYSSGGMSLVTKEKLVIDQLVYLEMNGCGQSVPETDRCFSGYVKWTANPVGSAGPYTYGIKFSKPVED